MIILAIYPALFILGYAMSSYEIYDSNYLQKKREYTVKPSFYNNKTILGLVFILTLLFLSYDYCSNNFGIDLQEEYANYKDKDLMFGKMNICQYAIHNLIINTLFFKYPIISYILYSILTIIILLFLYYSGILDSMFMSIFIYFGNVYKTDMVLPQKGYIGNLLKLYKCKGSLLNTISEYIYDNI